MYTVLYCKLSNEQKWTKTIEVIHREVLLVMDHRWVTDD